MLADRTVDLRDHVRGLIGDAHLVVGLEALVQHARLGELGPGGVAAVIAVAGTVVVPLVWSAVGMCSMMALRLDAPCRPV